MSEQEWKRFQTKLSGCFYASVVFVFLGIVVTCCDRVCGP